MLLRTALAFFILTLVAGVVGFAGRISHSSGVVQTLFFLFLSGFLVMLLTGLATARGRAG